MRAKRIAAPKTGGKSVGLQAAENIGAMVAHGTRTTGKSLLKTKAKKAPDKKPVAKKETPVKAEKPKKIEKPIKEPKSPKPPRMTKDDKPKATKMRKDGLPPAVDLSFDK